MKALSLWQPEASLVIPGPKGIETRSWQTKYRGPLLICSAWGGRSVGELIHLLSIWQIQGGLAPLVGRPLPKDLTRGAMAGVRIEHLPFGKALGIIDLVDIRPTDDLTQAEIGNERLWGDFSLGRYAWFLENKRAFKNPLPIKGRQRLFEVDDRLLEGLEVKEAA